VPTHILVQSETLYVEDYNASYLDEIERLRPDLEMDVYEEDISTGLLVAKGASAPIGWSRLVFEGWDDSVFRGSQRLLQPDLPRLMLWVALCLDFSPLVVLSSCHSLPHDHCYMSPLICLPIPFYRQVVITLSL